MKKWFFITQTVVSLSLQGVSTQAMGNEEEQMRVSSPVHLTPSEDQRRDSFPASAISWIREQEVLNKSTVLTDQQRLLQETVLKATNAEVDFALYAKKTLKQTKPHLENLLSSLKQPAVLIEDPERISSVQYLKENGESHFCKLDGIICSLEKEKRKILSQNSEYLLFEDLIYYYKNYKKSLMRAHSPEQLKEILTPKVRLTGDHLGFYLISQKMSQDLSWKGAYGHNLHKTNQTGNHRVLGRAGVHFKLSNDAHTEEGGVNELCPGVEYAISSLYQLLDARIAPPSTLLVIQKQRYYQLPVDHPFTAGINLAALENNISVEDFLNRNPDVKKVLEKAGIKSYKERRFLQGSLTAGDMGLDEFLRQSQQDPSLLNKIDRYSFSALCIGALITNPSDWKPDNFRVKIERDSENNIKSAILIAIDNDDALVPSIKPLYIKDHIVGPKNVLYFLKDLMNEPIDPKFREDFLKKSPDDLILEWVNSLEGQNKRYASLHSEGVLNGRNLQNLSLPIGFLPGTLVKIREKLVNIYNCVSKSDGTTHTSLFRNIDPVVSYYYDKLMRCSVQKLLSIVANKNPDLVKNYEAILKKETCRPLLLTYLLYGQGTLTTLSIEDICNLNHPFKIGNKYFTLDEILEEIKFTKVSSSQKKTEELKKAIEDVVLKTLAKKQLPSRRIRFTESCKHLNKLSLSI